MELQPSAQRTTADPPSLAPVVEQHVVPMAEAHEVGFYVESTFAMRHKVREL